MVLLFLSGKRDSNSRPRPWQGRALPTELLPLFPPLLRFGTANLSLNTKFPNHLDSTNSLLYVYYSCWPVKPCRIFIVSEQKLEK